MAEQHTEAVCSKCLVVVKVLVPESQKKEVRDTITGKTINTCTC